MRFLNLRFLRKKDKKDITIYFLSTLTITFLVTSMLLFLEFDFQEFNEHDTQRLTYELFRALIPVFLSSLLIIVYLYFVIQLFKFMFYLFALDKPEERDKRIEELSPESIKKGLRSILFLLIVGVFSEYYYDFSIFLEQMSIFLIAFVFGFFYYFFGKIENYNKYLKISMERKAEEIVLTGESAKKFLEFAELNNIEEDKEYRIRFND
jgi:hypothetical protein